MEKNNHNFKPLNFYHKLPGVLQDEYFDGMKYGGDEPTRSRHLHTASLFFDAVLTMDNNKFNEMESGDGEAIKEASLFFIEPFEVVIQNNNLYEKYPEYVV